MKNRPLIVSSSQCQTISDGGRLWPRITVVTPSFNQGRFLEETIRSVLGQGYPNLEYMVIDGGSTDNSVEIIRKYQDSLTFWTCEPDRGQADAINKGWRRATGDILAYINSDDTYHPNALRLVAEAFARDSAIALVYGRCLVIDERGAVIRERPVRQASLADVLRWSPSIPQPTMFVRRAAVEAVGFLNPDLHYTMDYDLSIRVGLKYKMQFIPHVLANTRDHPAAKTAIAPLEHVEEGITVARAFFAQDLPPEIAGLKNQTLASLYLRKARVHCRNSESSLARTLVRKAVESCQNASILWKSAVVLLMSVLGGGVIAQLRRFKRALLSFSSRRRQGRTPPASPAN
jgi:cellulose synthase/poly-beta-1,6-N-acetylglucosamine synthase-like glycosyltransferase